MIVIQLLVLLVLQLHQCTSFDLKGKRVLVTGASGGIGAGIAKRLALEEGCHVLLHYNERKEGVLQTQATIGPERCAGIVQCDFTRSDNIRAMMDTIDADVWPDGFDVLINNAGKITKRAILDDNDSLRAFDETLRVNLYAPLLLSKLSYKRMLQRKDSSGGSGGCIINVSSIHGLSSVEYMSAYACSKAGLDSLTKSLAVEFAKDGIRVNSINPGVVPVERTAALFEQPGAKEMWAERIALGALGTIEQVAEATIPLIKNDWMTGSIVVVDGGLLARGNYPNRPRPVVPPIKEQDDDDDDVVGWF